MNTLSETIADTSRPANQYELDYAYAFGGPVGQCRFKSCHSDFRVTEELPFDPVGEGEHLYLLVEKQGDNTDWVAGQLAQFAGVKRQSVSYAGRKDRLGVTRQWFCVSLPGMDDPDWQGLESETLKILVQARHQKKLRTGTLKSNHFVITLRDIDADKEDLESRLKQVAGEGVPNYYGPQRFGHGGRNLSKAIAMFEGRFRVQRNKRSMYLSAARSWIFNKVLSLRVASGNWNQCISGDVLGFHDSKSLIFDAPDEGILQRLATGDLSPTAPLWGRGEIPSSSDCLQLEQSAAAEYSVLCDGLEHAGLKQERRNTRLIPCDMDWQWKDGATLVLSFRLPKGCFATTVLREILECREAGEG